MKKVNADYIADLLKNKHAKNLADYNEKQIKKLKNKLIYLNYSLDCNNSINGLIFKHKDSNELYICNSISVVVTCILA